jgi:hypothetical protein
LDIRGLRAVEKKKKKFVFIREVNERFVVVKDLRHTNNRPWDRRHFKNEVDIECWVDDESGINDKTPNVAIATIWIC